MTRLSNNYYKRELLTIDLGLICNGEKESARIAMSINNKCVLMNSVSSHTSFYEVIEKAVQQALKDVHSDSIDKQFHYPVDSFEQVHLEEKQTGSNVDESIKTSSSSSTRRGIDIEVNSSNDVSSHLKDIVHGETIDIQMKILQNDVQNLYPHFDYSPPVEDYNQIPKDMPEAMINMCNDQLTIIETT